VLFAKIAVGMINPTKFATGLWPTPLHETFARGACFC
jgi:hypothetical protein